MKIKKKIANELMFIDYNNEDQMEIIEEDCRENGQLVDDVLEHDEVKGLRILNNHKWYEDGSLVQKGVEAFYSEPITVQEVMNTTIQRYLTDTKVLRAKTTDATFQEDGKTYKQISIFDEDWTETFQNLASDVYSDTYDELEAGSSVLFFKTKSKVFKELKLELGADSQKFLKQENEAIKSGKGKGMH